MGRTAGVSRLVGRPTSRLVGRPTSWLTPAVRPRCLIPRALTRKDCLLPTGRWAFSFSLDRSQGSGGEAAMFESAELGNKIDKQTYKQEAPKVRADLLRAQEQLASADFSVIVVVAGFEGAGKSETVNL